VAYYSTENIGRNSEMKTALLIFVIILTAFAYFVGLLVEVYKKFIRKDKSPDWENKLVAFVLSVGFAVALFFIFDTEELMLSAVRNNPAIIVAYSVCLYLLQKPACMAFWKPIFKKLIERNVQ